MKISITDLDLSNAEDLNQLGELVQAFKTKPKTTRTRKAKQETAKQETDTISLDDLKVLLADKMRKDKAKVLAHFKTYGAAKVSALDPSHYASLKQFLETV